MRLARMTGIIVLTAVVVIGGCRSKKAATTAPSAMAGDERTARAIQESFQQVYPGTRVGLVLAVKTEARLAAIGDVDVKDFAQGQAVTFIDAQKNTLLNGRVINIVDGFVHVKYEPPKPGHRAPREGDLAVRFSH